MKKLTVLLLALAFVSGPAHANQKIEEAALGDMVGAYTMRGDYLRAYCLLYSRLDKNPDDLKTQARLRQLQRTVARSKAPITDPWTKAATMGFFHFTAGDRIKARKSWGKALKVQNAPHAVRERILHCLLMPPETQYAAGTAMAAAPTAPTGVLLDAPNDLPAEEK